MGPRLHRQPEPHSGRKIWADPMGLGAALVLVAELGVWAWSACMADGGLFSAVFTHLPAGVFSVPPLLLLLLALVRRHWRAGPTASAALLIGLFPLDGLSLGGLSLSGSISEEVRPDEGKASAPFSVITYNVEQWSHGADNVARTLVAAAPDLFCLQEAGTYDYVPNIARQLAELRTLLRNHHITQRDELIIGSRFPVLSETALPFPNGPASRPLLEVVVRTPSGKPLSILTAHFIYGFFHSRSLASVLQTGEEREIQASFVEQYASRLDHPAVLCGDLNTSFHSASLRTLKRTFNDVWSELGVGFGLTFSSQFPHRRLDYILEKGLNAQSIEVLPLNVSDHRPVRAVFTLPNR